MRLHRSLSWRACAAATLAALLSLGVACNPGGGATATSTAGSGGAVAMSTPLSGRISVFAASSLTDVFKAEGAAFMKAHPGVSVEFNFQSSSALATQIEQGAPADLFASADVSNMQRLVGQGLIADVPASFARNAPVIAVPADNRAQIATPKDLAKPGVKLVLAGPDVPIGNYARQVIDQLAADPAYGVAYRDATLMNLVSNEANVRAILTKVELGEADAGIVYRTDALASGPKVKTVAIPDSANVIANYPIAVVRSSRNAKVAAAFIAFLGSAEGRRLLTDAGFDAIGPAQ